MKENVESMDFKNKSLFGCARGPKDKKLEVQNLPRQRRGQVLASQLAHI